MGLMPENISSFGGEIDSLIGFISVIAIVVFILAEVILIGMLLFFRKRKNGKVPYIRGVGWRQLRWVLLPVVAVVVLDFLIDIKNHEAWSAVMQSLPSDGLKVRVTGRQYQWSFSYPGPDGILGTADDIVRNNDFVVPRDTNVIFELAAVDVLHSFWVPSLRFKQDAVPGRIITRWFRAIKEGSYPIACAELCGTGHSLMHATLHVVPPEKFQEELVAGLTVLPENGGPGLALLKSKGCVACHTLNGTKLVGPSYLGIFGRKTKLADGREIIADEEYLNRSIENPSADVVEGFPQGLMPKLGLTAEERKAVVDYLKTLR